MTTAPRPTEVPRPRAVFDAIPGYRAGRQAPDEELKLSSNENPFPPLPGVVARAARELERVNRYPDAGVGMLTDALARRLERRPDAFAAGTGSVSVLFSLLDAYCGPGDEVVTAWRSFEAYPIGITVTGARHVTVPLRADHTHDPGRDERLPGHPEAPASRPASSTDDRRTSGTASRPLLAGRARMTPGLSRGPAHHDLDAMAAAVTDRTRVVVVCTPNNPTGPVVRHDDLERFVASVPSDVLIVVDEAYVEFVRDAEAARGLELQARHDNVVVLRTFSKAYGLAGLRVGYLVGHPDVVAATRKASPPFGVSDVAQAAAVASLEAHVELAERVEAVVEGRTVLLDGMRELGWDVPDSQANFVWLPTPDGPDVASALWPVAVRPFPGAVVDGGGVRVSVGTPEANARVLAAVADLR